MIITVASLEPWILSAPLTGLALTVNTMVGSKVKSPTMTMLVQATASFIDPTGKVRRKFVSGMKFPELNITGPIGYCGH